MTIAQLCKYGWFASYRAGNASNYNMIKWWKKWLSDKKWRITCNATGTMSCVDCRLSILVKEINISSATADSVLIMFLLLRALPVGNADNCWSDHSCFSAPRYSILLSVENCLRRGSVTHLKTSDISVNPFKCPALLILVIVSMHLYLVYAGWFHSTM